MVVRAAWEQQKWKKSPTTLYPVSCLSFLTTPAFWTSCTIPCPKPSHSTLLQLDFPASTLSWPILSLSPCWDRGAEVGKYSWATTTKYTRKNNSLRFLLFSRIWALLQVHWSRLFLFIKGDPAGQGRACFKRRRYVPLHTQWKGSWLCHYFVQSHIILPLRTVCLFLYQWSTSDWAPSFWVPFIFPTAHPWGLPCKMKQADKVNKEFKVDKEFEWRENDTCQDRPWKTKLLHTPASLGKVWDLKGRCLTLIPFLKKNIVWFKRSQRPKKTKI